MADVLYGQHAPSRTLYAQFWTSTGTVWNGASFEAYDAARWAFYDVALTEKGSSGVYSVAIPAMAAATYVAILFDQGGGAVAEGDLTVGAATVAWDGSALVDTSDIITHGDAAWVTIPTATVSGAVLTNPTLKLACNAAGEVVASNMRGTDSANTTTPPTVEAIRIEMDANSKLVAIEAYTNEVQSDDIPALIATAQSDLDKLTGADGATLATAQGLYAPAKAGDAMTLEADAVSAAALAAAAVAEIQSGLATTANVTTITNAIAALNDLDATEIASAVQDTVIDGAQTLQTLLKIVLAVAGGKCVVDDSGDPITYTYYADDDTTPVLVLSVATSGLLRTGV